jgi:Protein of unknown function, DUF481
MRLSTMPKSTPRLVRLAALSLAYLVAAGVASIVANPLALSQTSSSQKAAPKPAPDVIVFTNGDQLTGKLEKGAGDSVTFNSDMAGEITVPLAKIKELRTNGSFALLRNDTKTPTTNVQIGTISYEDGNLIVAAPAGSQRVPAKDMAFLIDQTTYEKEVAPVGGRFNDKKLLHGWTGSLTGGATLVRSTQDNSTYTAAVALTRAIPVVEYLPPKDRTIFGLTETYGKLTQPAIPQTTPPTVASVAMTNIFHAGLEQDEYFTPRVYALGSMTFDHDYSQGLDLQQVYGGGVGWTVIKDTKQELDVKGQLQYERQSFQVASNNENLIGATIGENYTRKLPRSIVFTETADALPAFNNANAYSANATAGVTLPVWKRFNLSFTTIDNFLNNPPAGFKKNSFQFVTGVTYTLP